MLRNRWPGTSATTTAGTPRGRWACADRGSTRYSRAASEGGGTSGKGTRSAAARARRQFGQLAPSVLAILLITTPGLTAEDSNEAWAALVKGGYVAVIRHGNAPPGYGGDPPGFRFDDCKTQQNLDDIGREQAKALGEAFRKQGVRVDRIVSSPVWRGLGTLVLVTHALTVGPLTGFLPEQAETVVLKPTPESPRGAVLWAGSRHPNRNG